MARIIPSCGLAALLWGALIAPANAYHLGHEIRIPGAEGWDLLSMSPHDGRLFVAHGTHVEVLDTASLELIGTVADTPGVHGVAIADDLGRGYVSAGESISVVVFDLKTLARITEIKTTGGNPDAILYDPRTQRVFTFNGRGRNVTAIDAKRNAVVGSIWLGAKPELAVLDDAGHLFVNLEDTHSIAQIDPKALGVVATWGMEGCEEPSGLAIDSAHHRLFSVCSNRVMAVVDSVSGKVVARVPIGAGVDGAGFDPATQLAFASGGDGTLTIVKEQTPNVFKVTETVRTKTGARTMIVEERTHRVFLATAQREPVSNPAAGARPKVIPDTFEVLVVEP